MYKIVILTIVIVYLLLLLIFFGLLIIFIKNALAFSNKYPNLSTKIKHKRLKKYLNIFFKKTLEKEEILKKTINFNNYTSPISKLFFGIIDFLDLCYTFPIFLLRMLFAYFNPIILWILPISLYELWYGLLILISFSLINNNMPIAGITISILNILFMLNHLRGHFKTDKKGFLELYNRPRHKIRIMDIIEDWMLIVFSYSSLYFGISSLNSSSFSKPLDIMNSIYFSFVTIATLGYGDITPCISIAQIITITEIFIGFFFTIFIIALFINVWIKKRSDLQ